MKNQRSKSLLLNLVLMVCLFDFLKKDNIRYVPCYRQGLRHHACEKKIEIVGKSRKRYIKKYNPVII
jgi:hypothetical protein